MFKEKGIQVFDDVFSKSICNQIYTKVRQPKWWYGHGSMSGPEISVSRGGIPFWKMDLDDDSFFTKEVFDKIKNVVEEPTLKLDRVYANGHVFGDKGMPHVDWNSYDIENKGEGKTFLFYANEKWDVLWGGKTAFYFAEGKTMYLEPASNRAVFFPGILYHCAEEVSRNFQGLRVTVAWKTYV